MAKRTKTDRLLGSLRNKKPIVSNKFILPNHSGDHSRGKVRVTPEQDTQIPNKKYVDDEIDAKIEDGTAAGQVAFWNGTKWVHTETSELVWDDTNKRVGIGNASPSVGLHMLNPFFGVTVQDTSGNGMTLRLQTTGGFWDLECQAGGDLSFQDEDVEIIKFNATGIGIGTTATIPLDVGAKAGMSSIGGHCIKLTNKTGANSVQGQLVRADTATNDAVILAGAGDTECFGVFLEAGVADGAEAWIVVGGIADVALDDNVAAVRGNWMATGVGAGYARTGASPAASPQHFEEIGHCIETVAAGGAGTHILARCVLHFL